MTFFHRTGSNYSNANELFIYNCKFFSIQLLFILLRGKLAYTRYCKLLSQNVILPMCRNKPFLNITLYFSMIALRDIITLTVTAVN